jgi:hypothetical protein
LTDVHEGEELSAVEARAIAKEAYISGFPMLDEYRVMYSFSIDTKNPQYKGPFNSILNIARVFTPEDTAFVTPNSDTPYSFANLDLRAEPVIISLPAIEKERYFVFQMMDLYTFNFDYLGTRATGNDGGDFLIAGPDWTGSAPAGVKKVIRSETQLVMLVGRTQLFNPGDLDNLKRVQAGYKIATLSAYVGQAPKPAAEAAWKAPLSAEDQRSSPEFFGMLGYLLQFCPTHPSEIELRARFAKIGILPGKPLDTKALPADMQQALREGMADGQQEIDARRPNSAARSMPSLGHASSAQRLCGPGRGRAGRDRRQFTPGSALSDLQRRCRWAAARRRGRALYAQVQRHAAGERLLVADRL